MRRFITILVFFSLLLSESYSQFISGELPIKAQQIRSIYTDSINNKLYVAGALPLDSTGSYLTNSIWILDGNTNTWASLDTINDLIFTLCVYQNELYVGGIFQTVNGQSNPYFVKWDGANWQNLGTIDAPVVKLKILNGELYAMGYFTQIGGISANRIAKFNGSIWTTAFNFPTPDNSTNLISDATYFNGELYVGGNFSIINDSIYDLARFRNGVWERVGVTDYLRGGALNLWCMEAYKNNLYVGGLILKSEGNVGYGVQKWDGYSWSEVGTGLKNELNTTSGNLTVRRMEVYNNKLYMSGGFFYAGDIPAVGFATWDGNFWCTNSNFLRETIPGLFTFFEDTLYIGNGYDTINGEYVNQFAKWSLGNDLFDTCSLPMSVSENRLLEGLVYPNPTTGEVNIVLGETNSNTEYKIRLYDISGKLIIDKKVFPQLNQLSINLTNFATGSYILQINTSNFETVKTLKIIKY